MIKSMSDDENNSIEKGMFVYLFAAAAALPAGWSIVLESRGLGSGVGEISLGLIGPDGNDVAAEWGNGELSVRKMVDHANNAMHPERN